MVCRSACVVGLVCGLAACGSKTDLRQGAPAGVVLPASCQGTVTESPPIELIDDNGVARQQLLHTASGWAALLEVNLAGRYEALLYLIDDGQATSRKAINLTDDFEPSVRGAWLARDRGALLLAWSDDTSVFLRSVTLAGSFGPIVKLEAAVSSGVPIFFPGEQGLDFWLRSVASERPRALRAARDGSTLAGPEFLYPEYDGPGYDYGSAWLWPDRVLQKYGQPSGPQELRIGTFEYGQTPVQGARVYQSAESFLVTSTVLGERPLAGLYDAGSGGGVRILELPSQAELAGGAATAVTRYQLPAASGKRPALTPRADCGYALLADRGEWTAINPLSTDLDLYLLTPDFVADHGPLQVSSGGGNSCLEHHDVATSADGRVAVLWTEGCTGSRRVQLSRFTVRP